jgi:hypothetical protein
MFQSISSLIFCVRYTLMRRKLAGWRSVDGRMDGHRFLTISLGGLDLGEKTLEPPKRRGITTDPEELDSPERA